MKYSQNIRVLLIEDNPGDVLLIRNYVEQQEDVQFDFTITEKLSEGIAKIETEDFHIILLDLSLPDGKGIDTFVRLHYRVKDIPIVVLTGTDDEKVAMAAVSKGAQDYLVKDQLSATMLVRAMRYAIERARAEEKRRWLEMKVLHAQKLESLSALSGTAAQNFNSLLTAIMGNAELAQEKLPIDSSALRNIQKIEYSAKQASELANQMLTYSSKSRMVVESFNLSGLIREMIPFLRNIISKKTDLKFNLDDDVPLMKADVPQMRQMVLNLVANASEALTEERGMITIRSFPCHMDEVYLENHKFTPKLLPGLFSCLEITDSGCGIPQEYKSKIFDPFFTTKFTGRGLGLAAVLGIVRGHLGGINIKSRRAEGTTIKVCFPGIKPDIPQDYTSLAGAYRKITGTILFVDESQEVVDVARDGLEGAGFTVISESDQGNIIKRLKNPGKHIDLIVLDLSHPRPVSNPIIKKIRQQDPGIKILVTGNYENGNIPGRITSASADAILKKPYGSAKLLSTIHEVLTLKF